MCWPMPSRPTVRRRRTPADLLGFGAPNWLGLAARHFGIDLAAADARFTDYTAANDLVLINGVERLGLYYQLPAFTGLSGVPPRIRAQPTHPKLRSRLMRQKRGSQPARASGVRAFADAANINNRASPPHQPRYA